ncbi:MAG: DUF3990 domain-containing protein [Defluviitaleaceae bacterium]|nr:DUF3990 domain-containing protein [Defluviitaleaceae bacterium]
MIIYHGSTVPVEKPQIMKSERKLDFGEGFYTTYNREQAIRWSERVAVRRKTSVRIITEYEFSLLDAEKSLQIISFNKPDEAWLDFISANRNGHALSKLYDIVIGPVANDVVYTAVLLYEQGLLDKDAAIKRLKVQALYNQILFHTDASLQFCNYIRHEVVGG